MEDSKIKKLLQDEQGLGYKEPAPSLEDCGAAAIGLGEGQSLISNPVYKKEADEAYYNQGKYDEDQTMSLELLKLRGTDVSEYVTPANSPEQMFELANSVSLGIPSETLKLLANPGVSFMAIQVINKAYKAGYDLTRFLPWADPQVLNEALLAARSGLDLDKLVKPGLNSRQIEQRRKLMELGQDPDSVEGNYNLMRAKRFPGSDISNMKSHTPKGKGVSTHTKRRSTEEMENKSAWEGIPQRFKEYALKRFRHPIYKRDSNGDLIPNKHSSYTPEVGSQGNPVFDIDRKGMSKFTKQWANLFASNGISINDLGDFDQYKLDEGIELDRPPRGALTIAYIPEEGFLFMDKRSPELLGNSNWGEHYMVRQRDGKYVDVSRIPDKQLLHFAKDVWVIPEEAISKDTRETRKDRIEARKGTVERYRTDEEKDRARRWLRRDQAIDKSGYLVDNRELLRKLDEFKKKNKLDKFGGDPVGMAISSLSKITEKFNKAVSKIFREVENRLASDQPFSPDLSRALELIPDAKEQLVRAGRDLDGYQTTLANAIKVGDKEAIEYFGKFLPNLALDLEKASKGETSGNYSSSFWTLGDFFKITSQAGVAIESYSPKGQLRNRTLSATEGYYIDQEILKGLED